MSVLRRLRDQVVEVLRVHLERQRLELGRDLLEAEAGPQARSRRTGRGGGARSAVTTSSGVMFLRSRNVPCWSVAGQAAVDGDEHERPVVEDEPLGLEARRDRRGGVAALDDELHLCRIGRGAAGSWPSRCPRATMSLTNGIESAAGLSAAQPRIALLTSGRRAVSATASTIPPSTSAKIRNLTSPPIAAAAAARTVPVAAAATRDRLRVRRDGLGRIRVRVVRMGLRGAGIAGASAGADRHGRLSEGSLGRVRDDAGPGASVELILEDDRGRLAVDASPIGVALGLRRRPARPASLHRTQAVLGEVAGQALVAKG